MPKIVDSETASDVFAIEDYPVKRTPVEKKKPNTKVIEQPIPPLMDSLAKIESRSARKKLSA